MGPSLCQRTCAAALLVEVNDHSRALFDNLAPGGLELVSAITGSRREHLTVRASGLQPHECGSPNEPIGEGKCLSLILG